MLRTSSGGINESRSGRRGTEALLYIDQARLQGGHKAEKSCHGKQLTTKRPIWSTNLDEKMSKMYRISKKVINFIVKAMETEKWNQQQENKPQQVSKYKAAGVKIQRGIFPTHSLLLRLFLITIMPLNYILRKCTGAQKFTES